MRFLWLVFFATSLFSAPPIVFVHLGPKIPFHLPTAISQARLFNPESPIYLVASHGALQSTAPFQGVKCVAYETLPLDPLHATFISQVRLYRSYREPWWRYSIERFFLLYELMQSHQLTEVVHLENDVMLYCDLNELMPCFRAHYPGKIGVPFVHDQRCIPGIVYIATPKPLGAFLDFLLPRLRTQSYDMFYLAQFYRAVGSMYIEPLPIVTPFYAAHHELITLEGQRAENAETYTRYFEDFRSLFDAASIGQYLGGIDPIHGPITPGFINESCVFNPTHVEFEWIRDEQGRLVPYLQEAGWRYRINNLHIHSKNLTAFHSQRN